MARWPFTKKLRRWAPYSGRGVASFSLKKKKKNKKRKKGKKEKRIWLREEKNGEWGDFLFSPHKNCDLRRSNGPIFDSSSET
jgi:hypothetical protein